MDGLLATGPRHAGPARETRSLARLIGDASPPYNAGSCRGGALLSARHGRPSALVSKFVAFYRAAPRECSQRLSRAIGSRDMQRTSHSVTCPHFTVPPL